MPADSPIKNHPAERRLFLVRIIVAGLLMSLLLGVLLTRLSFLQILDHGYYNTRSDDNRTRVQVVPPVRGLIYDRNGVVLADNVPAYRLEIVPERIKDLHAAIKRLSRIITIRDVDKERFFKRMRSSPAFRGTPIRLNLNKQELARFEVNRGDFPGMEIRAGLTRHYPLGQVAAHVVGYVGGITERDLLRLNDKLYRGTNHIGKTGVEKSYEPLLHGKPGSRVMETNAAGRSLRDLQFHPPTPGRNLYLTLDAHLQQVAFNALGDYDGAVVALDPRTGGVLAMVSKPSYDPSLFIDGISHKDYNALLHNPHRPLFNRSLQGRYPPGSTIKPVMAIAALESHNIDPQRKVFCPGYITLPGSSRKFHDWKRSGHGWIDLTQAIYRSSDVYFYKLAQDMGIDVISRYGKLFGFGRKTGIDLPRENPGLMPSRAWKHGARGKPWYPGETLNTVIGQGYFSATPLQLAQMTALIGSRGIGHKPHVLMASENASDGTLQSAAVQATKPIRLNNDRHWKIVINAMEDVVSNPRGTAHYYIGRNLSYRLAGKSGTAQVAGLAQNEPVPDENTVARHLRPHALFVAFAPAGDPRIAVAVVVAHGGGGSSTASPVARKVIDAYLPQDSHVAQGNTR